MSNTETQYANNVESSTVNDPLNASDTTITLPNSAAFPAITGDQYFYATLDDVNGFALEEVVKVTAHDTGNNSMTVERGVDNTTAAVWPVNTRYSMRDNAKIFEELRDHTHTGEYSPEGHGHDAVEISYTGIPPALNVSDALDEADTQIALRETAATGVLSGGAITAASTTTVDITAGEGEIVDAYTNRTEPTRLKIAWNAASGFAITMSQPIGAQVIYVDQFGVVQQKATKLSDPERRSFVQLGVIYYRNGVIDVAYDVPTLSNSVAHMLYDWMSFLSSVGRAKGLVVQPVDTLMSMWVSEGALFIPGANAYVDIKTPNVVTAAQLGDNLTPVPFDVLFEDGSIYLAAQTVMPEFWESAPGVATAVGGNDAVIHYFYRTNGGQYLLQLGQVLYISGAIARDAIASDRTTFRPFIGSNVSISSAQVYMQNNTANFDDAALAGIVNILAGTGGGGGGISPVFDWLGLDDVYPTSYSSEVGSIVKVNDAATGLDFAKNAEITGTRVRWLNRWVDSTYENNDMVIDGVWTMIANKQTADRAAPQTIGTADFLLPDVPTWSNLNTVNYVLSGMRISGLNVTYQVTDFRIWISNVAASQSYELVTRDNLTGVVTTHNKFTGDILPAIGWLTVAGDPVLIGPTEDKSVLVLTQNSAGTTDYNHPWIYVGESNNEADPGLGNITTRNGQGLIRVSTTDRDAVDRTAEVDLAIAGTLLRLVSELDNTQYYEYEVIINDTTTINYNLYTCTLVDTGPGGGPPNGANVQLYFEVPIAAATDYSTITNHFLDSPFVQGEIGIGTTTTSLNDNGYGIDITVQEFQQSEDWDIAAVSGGAGGGGGGSFDRFLKLLDTPVDFIGQAGKGVFVNTAEDALEFAAGFLPINGSEPMTGDLVLNDSTPNTGLSATSKDYVEANFVTLATTQTNITGSKTFTGALISSNSTEGIQWENGRSRITYNDGAGNCQIRMGNKVNSGEVFTAAGSGAARIRCDIDSEQASLQLSVASNTGVANGDAVTWGTELLIAHNALTWGGNQIPTVTQVVNLTDTQANIAGNKTFTGFTTFSNTSDHIDVRSTNNITADIGFSWTDGIKRTILRHDFTTFGLKVDTYDQLGTAKYSFEFHEDGWFRLPRLPEIDSDAANKDYVDRTRRTYTGYTASPSGTQNLVSEDPIVAAWTISYNSTGVYSINHTLNTHADNLHISITATSPIQTPVVSLYRHLSNSDIEIRFFNLSGTSVDTAFSFSIIRQA